MSRSAVGQKDLAKIGKCFLKAADADTRVTALLEAPICEPPEPTATNSSLPGKPFLDINKSVNSKSYTAQELEAHGMDQDGSTIHLSSTQGRSSSFVRSR